jgi:uncharacterized protein YwgA
MKSREEIIAKADELKSAEEDSVEMEAQQILLEIAGTEASSMLSDEDIEELLYCKDIYHYQSEAVRMIRKFLAA